VPGDQFAKCVVLTDGKDFVMTVLPATHHLDLDRTGGLIGRSLRLATEEELGRLFGDCAPGAVPPVGAAYDVDAVIDESLTGGSDIFFEAGDHTDIVHVSGSDFRTLVEGCRTGRFSHHLGH
jgi:Ala-tRNA(Pro) deacylase